MTRYTVALVNVDAGAYAEARFSRRSTAEWLRRLARRELDDETAPGAESVEA